MAPQEVEAVRRGLLALRQNVVLLRDPDDPNAFYPVGPVGSENVVWGCVPVQPGRGQPRAQRVRGAGGALGMLPRSRQAPIPPRKLHTPLPSLTAPAPPCCPRPAPQRFALASTSSFKALEQHWRDELVRLHNDYYHHRQDALWRQQSHRTLPALMGATDMLVGAGGGGVGGGRGAPLGAGGACAVP